MQTKPLILALLGGLAVSGAAQAALIDRGGGLIYDDVLDITWLQDANYAMTNGYDVDGRMSWDNALAWAANLSYYDSVRGVTYDDWRLPNTLQPDSTCSGQYDAGAYGIMGWQANCTGSELGYMFYTNMGATAPNSILSGSNAANLALFTNLQSHVYWSSLEFAVDTDLAWDFQTVNGTQYVNDKNNDYYAWAVRPGDVAAVPEPATLLLLGLGLAGLGAMRRRG